MSRPENPFNELPSDLPKELPRKDGADAVFPGPSLEPASGSSGVKATGTLKRPTSLSRHASAAGFPLSGAASWTLGRSHRSPLTAASPGELPTEGAGPDVVEDISHLLADVARFAEGLEKLKECVLHDGESHGDTEAWVEDRARPKGGWREGLGEAQKGGRLRWQGGLCGRGHDS